ncbi:S1 family peptidase [Actinokineospora fastidiosa]|nr:S1 family peptidase [Actinokineospora fastidiosa]
MAAPDPRPEAARAVDTAAAQLARDHGVSTAEAARRIERQDAQLAMADEMKARLGQRFGGAWIDHDRGGRLTVAVAGPEKATAGALTRTVTDAAASKGLTDTHTVFVKRTEADLDRISARLAERIAGANSGAEHGLQSAIDVTRNLVRLDLPKDKALTKAQQEVVNWARNTYGDAIEVAHYANPSVPRYCGGQYSCDPPLRSGLATYMGGGRCTTAFMTYAGSYYYMLTAGHCAEMGSYFSVPTYTYGTQTVGVTAGYDFGYYGDSAVVRVSDASWWQPRGWVYPQTAIRSYGYDYVGQYVCKQGSTTGYTCGQVTETNATVYYPGRTLTGMTWSTACVAAGDSGSGVYYGSRAYGILSGGPNSGCGMIHEPITRALSRWGVTLLAG